MGGYSLSLAHADGTLLRPRLTAFYFDSYSAII